MMTKKTQAIEEKLRVKAMTILSRFSNHSVLSVTAQAIIRMIYHCDGPIDNYI